MANNNVNLGAAKEAKNDEFYTQLSDIENELKHYRKHFKDKIVLCNCDDPYESNFFKYFVLNFNRLKLKKVIATCYATSPVMGKQLSLFDFVEGVEVGTPYKAVITSVYDATGDGAINMDDITELFRIGENEISELAGDGDFRTDEVIELLKEADIVVTNPPFSLFREYVAQLIEYDKKFLIIGNQNAITYKEIFPLLKENKVWWGCGDCIRWFIVNKTDTGYKAKLNDKGELITEGARSRWFTNLDHKKRHDELICVRKYKGNDENYPKYDNYDAIEVSKVVDLPLDYKGVMGVPITFMDKYCPEQFEIVGSFNANNESDPTFCYIPSTMTPIVSKGKESMWNGPVVNRKALYKRICIRYTDQWIAEHQEDFKE